MAISSYTFKKEHFSFVPNAGIMYENTAINKLVRVEVAQTGGNLLTASGGIVISYKKITMGTNMQLPLSQRFADGQTDLKVRAWYT